MYIIEKYKAPARFGAQYDEIRSFLQETADSGYNEHFHWGRLDWMMAHSGLDIEMLSKIALFRDEDNKLVGVALFDTDYDNRWYLLHSGSDEKLLCEMVSYVTEMDGESVVVRANLKDKALCELLKDKGYKTDHSESVLEIDLAKELSWILPQGFRFNKLDEKIDDWQWRLVIYRGFGHEGTPEMPDEETIKAEERLECCEYIKVFIIKDNEYVAHCGVWYDGGETAYIEPVVTVPEHRGKSLGKAVVYEALNRAKVRGAKRGIVLSDLEFYRHIGMTKSSEIGKWTKKDASL